MRLVRNLEKNSNKKQKKNALDFNFISLLFRYIISCSVDFTLFGVATVFLILASQNLQSLLQQV